MLEVYPQASGILRFFWVVDSRHAEVAAVFLDAKVSSELGNAVHTEAENVLAFSGDPVPSEPLKAYKTSSTRLEIPKIAEATPTAHPAIWLMLSVYNPRQPPWSGWLWI